MVDPVLLIEPLAPLYEDDEVYLAADYQTPDGSHRLWFRIPRSIPIADRDDAFLVAGLFMAMRFGLPVHLRGRVSAALVHSLMEFQSVWHSFYPQRYHCVEITADEYLADKDHGGKGLITTFSGGVDSSYTVLSHHLRRDHARPLAAAVLIHGLDVQLSATDFRRYYETSKAMLQPLGIDCFYVSTNFREVIPQRWTDTFATVLAAVLHLFSGVCAGGVIPASHAYSVREYRYGSNPLTDPLLGGGGFSINHDGARFSRREKIEYLAQSQPFIDNLRVCWEGEDCTGNCCQCEKCVRNMLLFDLLGVRRSVAFPAALSAQTIDRLTLRGESIGIWQRLASDMRDSQLDDAIVRAVRKLANRSHKRTRLKKIYNRLIRR